MSMILKLMDNTNVIHLINYRTSSTIFPWSS